MQKKLFAVLLMLCLTGSLFVGCGKKAEQTADATSVETADVVSATTAEATTRNHCN